MLPAEQRPLLCFDLDGTLIDSAQDIATALNQTLQDEGAPSLSLEEVKSHIGEGVVRLLSGAFQEMNDVRLEALRAKFYHHYQNCLFENTRPYPGVDEFLKTWTGPLALITNKPSRFTNPLMKFLKWNELPWVAVFSADSLPERKPSPIPLFEAMKYAKIGPHLTYMIGDGIPDMECARAAKVRAVAACYGYSDPQVLESFQPHKRIEKFEDFVTWITSLS